MTNALRWSIRGHGQNQDTIVVSSFSTTMKVQQWKGTFNFLNIMNKNETIKNNTEEVLLIIANLKYYWSNFNVVEPTVVLKKRKVYPMTTLIWKEWMNYMNLMKYSLIFVQEEEIQFLFLWRFNSFGKKSKTH